MAHREKNTLKAQKRISIIIALIVAVLSAIHSVNNIEKSNINKENQQKINYSSVENLEVGQEYSLDADETIGCVWKTSVFNFYEFKKSYYRMYLIPVDYRKSLYMGLMVEERKVPMEDAVGKVFSLTDFEDDEIHYYGRLKAFDGIMSKKISADLENKGIDTSQITILPLYLDTCEPPRAYNILLAIVTLLIAILCGAFIFSYRNQVEQPTKEIRLYSGKSVMEPFGHQYIEEMDINVNSIWAWLFPYSYGRVKEKKSIYSAFKKMYAYKMFTRILGSSLVVYLLFGILYSFNIKKWYYGLYGIGRPITFIIVAFWMIVVIYSVIIWLINPVKLTIKKYMNQNIHYPQDYLEAVLSEGRLFASGGGYVYLTENFLVMGSPFQMSIIRHDKISRMTWCEKDEVYKNQRQKKVWFRVYENDETFCDVFITGRTASALIKYFKDYIPS